MAKKRKALGLDPGTDKHLRWYRLPLEPNGDDPEPHTLINNIFNSAVHHQLDRYTMYRRLWEQYGADCSMFGGQVDHYRLNLGEDIEANEMANAIETLHAKVFKNRVVPTYCSVAQDWDTFEQTKLVNRFLDGVWEDQNVSDEALPEAGLETIVCGTGVVEVGHELDSDGYARITIQKNTIQDYFIDPIEARDNKPLSIWRVKLIDRWKLLEEFGVDDPDLYGSVEARRKAILEAEYARDPNFNMSYATREMTDGDMLLVKEVWRAGSRHCISINNCTLLYEEWPRQWPQAFIRLMPPPGGFWGISYAARLSPMQNWLNELTVKVRDSHRLLGQPKLILRKGSGISKLHIDDSIAPIFEVDGSPDSAIREWNPVPITSDAYRERDSVPQRMRNLIGMSEFSATNSLPSQLREASGKAIESFRDGEDDRNAMFHKAVNTACKDIAKRILEHAQWLKDNGYKVRVMSPKGRDMEEIHFNEVTADVSEGRLRVFPVNQLSRSYTERMNELDRLLNRQAITMSTYRRLSENPDVEAQNDFDLSDEEIILKNLQYICKTGEPLEPIEFDNFRLIISMGTKFYNSVRVKGVEPDKLFALETYITKASAKLNASLAPPPPPPGQPLPPGSGPSASGPPGPTGSGTAAASAPTMGSGNASPGPQGPVA